MLVKVIKYIGNYFGIETDAETALRIIEKARDELGYDTDDVEDTLRMLKNFDVFYEMMRKKFKHFLSPRKRESDLIKGRVLVDKVKLTKEGEKRKALIIFDRRVNYDKIIEIIKSLGHEIEVSG